MSTLKESWLQIATTLGFENEKQMLTELYKNYSINEIAERIGYSRNNVRARLVSLGITLKSRGGPNRLGKGKVQLLPDEALKSLTPRKALELGFHPSAVYKEKRRRNAIRTDSTDPSLPEASAAATS